MQQLGFYFLAVIVALVLQTHLVFRDISVVWHVDLALLVMVSGCLQWKERRALVFGFVTGLMHDALSSDVMGLHAVSKAVVAYAALLLSRNVESHSLVLQSGFAALATALDTVTRLFVLAVFQSRVYPLPMMLQVVIPHALLAAVCMPLIHMGLRTAMQVLHLRPEQGQHDASV
ncbi:rod shape-determining protein MreD [Candidatus Entotheonella palauensis]|uniref:rod shape-determining protein MreD n=1 Tax=Candidatus Entotheonella palauensis TaxID=93172 RepID=UPI000B7DF386|nr:rod shape-determining protein MreD [Candidatus Entotheonella palauensis]